MALDQKNSSSSSFDSLDDEEATVTCSLIEINLCTEIQNLEMKIKNVQDSQFYHDTKWRCGS